MSRKTTYNNFKTQEDLSNVNSDNIYLLESFMDYLESLDRSYATIKEYRNNIEIFFVYLLNNKKNKVFTDITKMDIVSYQSYLLKKDLSPARIQALKRALSSFSNFIENMLEEEYPEFKNIINKIESPKKVAVREKTVITEEELNDILNILVEKGEIQLACAVAMVASCGLRKSEILRLKAQWFTDEYKINDGAIWKTPKIKTKGRGRKLGKQLNKFFFVPICGSYVDKWLQYRKENNVKNESMFLKNNLKDEATENVLENWAEKITKILGRPFYWHSLRHYVTTYFSKQGVPMDAIQGYLGWSNLEMVSLYDDRETEDIFEGIFTLNGINKKENKLDI